jgi:hypothetical protein
LAWSRLRHTPHIENPNSKKQNPKGVMIDEFGSAKIMLFRIFLKGLQIKKLVGDQLIFSNTLINNLYLY